MTGRDISSCALPSKEGVVEGRRVVAVVGIDRYRAWPALHNAVSDAQGTLSVFQQVGFEQLAPPLINEMATADAIRRLVTDDLATLGSDDSLVLFFAGHGHTQTRMLPSGPLQTGYIIPVDGDRPEGQTATWLRLDTWLSDVARIPVRHILVILDACHSGIALGSLIKWRGGGSARPAGSLDELRRRQSRRVITSALGDQLAMDGGPIGGHSLFTGCLIEGLAGGLVRDGRLEATGSEIGVYVQQRVTSYTGSQQTPDFGTLELDHRGELVVPIAADARLPQPIPAPPVDARLPQPIPAPPVDANLMNRSRRAIHEGLTGVVVRRDDQDAWRHSAAKRLPAVAVSQMGVPKPNPLILWGIRLVGIFLAGAPFSGITVHSTTRGVLCIIASLLIAIVIAVGRVVSTAPAIIRSFSAKMLRRKLWTGTALAAPLFGVPTGMFVRANLDQECSEKLAAADALQQTNRDGASTAFANAAKACAAIDRDDDVRRATKAAGELKVSESERKSNLTTALSESQQQLKTAPNAAFEVNGPSCADVIPKLGEFPGLLPSGVPRSAASRPLYQPHMRHSAVPIAVDGEVLFLENLITDGKLVVSREVGNELQPVHTIQLPSLYERAFSSDQFEVAVGDQAIGIVAIDSFWAFFLVIDKKTWAVRRRTPLFAEFSEIYSFLAPHVASGHGSFGVAMRGNQQGGPKHWTWAWQILGEDGRPLGKAKYLDSSTAIEPRVAWNGSNFVVLAGRVDYKEPVSLGAYVISPKEDIPTVYVPWLEPEGEPHEQQRLEIGGSLLWRDGMLHVAMKSDHWTKTEHDKMAQIIHADLGGRTRVERCPKVTLEDK